jgi:catalase
MLQGRLLFYGDAQRYRLGVNPHLIPANKARCPFHSHHRDGAMRGDGNHGSTLGCEPNSYREWRQQPGFAEPRLALEGAADKKSSPSRTPRWRSVTDRWMSSSAISATAARPTRHTLWGWQRH